MRAYLQLLSEVLKHGASKENRTGIGSHSLFARQLRCDLSATFPLLTSKKIHFKSVVHELLWFIRGDTNVAGLHQHGVTIWDEWADERGDLGPIYGRQWRAWQAADGRRIDQLGQLIENIRRQPDSRRLLISAWNVGELDKMRLAPCHVLFQFYVHKGRLSCQLYQRSADIFLGVPFNIASYALLTRMVAQVCGLHAYELIISFGDIHLYKNHVAQAREQLSRTPRPLPRLQLNPDVRDIDSFSEADIHLLDYNPHRAIQASVAV